MTLIQCSKTSPYSQQTARSAALLITLRTVARLPGGIYGYALQAKEAGQLGAEQPGCGNVVDGWQSPQGCTAEKKTRARELLTAHTLDDRFLSEMREVKQHSAVMKRSKRAALNYHFSQCCSDWLCAQGKITSKLSHAAEQLREKCRSVQRLSELRSYFYLILNAVEDLNLRIQPKCYKCVFFCSLVQPNVAVLSDAGVPL